MYPLKETLIIRDKITEQEANKQIQEMRERMFKGEDPDELLYEIGLEPDYAMDLIHHVPENYMEEKRG